MYVVCQKCSAAYNTDQSELRGEAHSRCPNCLHVQELTLTRSQFELQPAAPSRVAVEAAATSSPERSAVPPIAPIDPPAAPPVPPPHNALSPGSEPSTDGPRSCRGCGTERSDEFDRALGSCEQCRTDIHRAAQRARRAQRVKQPAQAPVASGTTSPGQRVKSAQWVQFDKTGGPGAE